jgi:hypothetical protein
MMIRRGLLALAFAMGIAASPANAAVLFTENFNNENGGVGTLNYAGFAQFTVSGGTVDLIGNGFFDFLPGNGLYVDLDGSTNNAGLMLATPLSLIAGTYSFTFDLAGSHRGTAESVEVSFRVNGGAPIPFIFTVNSGDPFSEHAITIVSGAPFTLQFGFEALSNDNIGALLDDVQLEGPAQVPEPASTLLLATALAAMAIRRRRARG